VALDHGARLVLCVNPIVPVDLFPSGNGNGDGNGHHVDSLVDRGLPSVLSQTFRTLIYSRLKVGIAAYADRYPGADVLLFEPRRDDPRMFFTNIFTFSARKAVCEYAYVATRRDLRERADVLEPVLARHGLRLRRDVLADEGRTIWQGLDFDRQGRTQATQTLNRLEALLDRLERALPG
jgi:NTE family protein